MRTPKKLTGLLLSVGSFAIAEASENICPNITGDQLSTVCLTTQVERVGMEAGEIVTKDGVRLLNNKGNCSTLTSLTAKLKGGKEPFHGIFTPLHGEKKTGQQGTSNIEIKGKCTYIIPKLLTGTQKIEFDITTTQKLIEGKRMGPMAGPTPPRIGNVKVENPPEHEKKPVWGIFKKKETEAEQKEELAEEKGAPERPSSPPIVTQNMPGGKPQIIEDYSREVPAPVRPRPLRPAPISEAEKQQLAELRKNIPTETAPVPSSHPPLRPPPLAPRALPTLPQPEPVPEPKMQEPSTGEPADFQSELEQKLAKRRAAQGASAQ